MFHLFKQSDIRNRAYVVDNKGNKLFYGTVYQCNRFIKYMKGGSDDERTTKNDSITEREKRS